MVFWSFEITMDLSANSHEGMATISKGSSNLYQSKWTEHSHDRRWWGRRKQNEKLFSTMEFLKLSNAQKTAICPNRYIWICPNILIWTDLIPDLILRVEFVYFSVKIDLHILVYILSPLFLISNHGMTVNKTRPMSTLCFFWFCSVFVVVDLFTLLFFHLIITILSLGLSIVYSHSASNFIQF